MAKQPTLALVDNDAPELIEEKSHTYRGDSDGPYVPGVSGLLRIQEAIDDTFGLERWKINTAVNAAMDDFAAGGHFAGIDDRRKSAMKAAFDAIYEPNRKGTRIHDGIDSLIQDEAYIPTPGDGGFWYAWTRFLMREKPEILTSEQYVLGDGFGGTYDFDAIIKGELALVDTKTGSYRSKFRLQLAGYSSAKWRAPKNGGQPVEAMPKHKAFYVLLLANDGSYDLLRQDVGPAELAHFRFLVDTYQRLNEWKERDAA